MLSGYAHSTRRSQRPLLRRASENGCAVLPGCGGGTWGGRARSDHQSLIRQTRSLAAAFPVKVAPCARSNDFAAAWIPRVVQVSASNLLPPSKIESAPEGNIRPRCAPHDAGHVSVIVRTRTDGPEAEPRAAGWPCRAGRAARSPADWQANSRGFAHALREPARRGLPHGDDGCGLLGPRLAGILFCSEAIGHGAGRRHFRPEGNQARLQASWGSGTRPKA